MVTDLGPPVPGTVMVIGLPAVGLAVELETKPIRTPAPSNKKFEKLKNASLKLRLNPEKNCSLRSFSASYLFRGVPSFHGLNFLQHNKQNEKNASSNLGCSPLLSAPAIDCADEVWVGLIVVPVDTTKNCCPGNLAPGLLMMIVCCLFPAGMDWDFPMETTERLDGAFFKLVSIFAFALATETLRMLTRVQQ